MGMKKADSPMASHPAQESAIHQADSLNQGEKAQKEGAQSGPMHFDLGQLANAFSQTGEELALRVNSQIFKYGS